MRPALPQTQAARGKAADILKQQRAPIKAGCYCATDENAVPGGEWRQELFYFVIHIAPANRATNKEIRLISFFASP